MLDVGGNLGQEPIIAAQHGLKTFTFEPFPLNVASLEFNSMINCAHEHVNIISKGTSDEPGVMCFDRSPSSPISFAGFAVKRSLPHAALHRGARAPSEPAHTSSSTTRMCLNLTTLDVELERSFDPGRRPLLLKIDNEGSELATLKGAHTLLSTRPPPIVIFEAMKISRSHDACVALLRGYGYEIYSTMQADAMMLNVDDEPKMTPTYRENGNYLEYSVDVIMIHLASFRQPAWRSILEAHRIAAIPIDGKPGRGAD